MMNIFYGKEIRKNWEAIKGAMLCIQKLYRMTLSIERGRRNTSFGSLIFDKSLLILDMCFIKLYGAL